jgi:hypothetical protein
VLGAARATARAARALRVLLLLHTFRECGVLYCTPRPADPHQCAVLGRRRSRSSGATGDALPTHAERHHDIKRSGLALVHDATERQHPIAERRFLDAKRVTWIVTAEPPGHATGEDAEPTPEGVLVFSSPVETRRLTRTSAHRGWLEAPSADLRAWCRTARPSRTAR